MAISVSTATARVANHGTTTTLTTASFSVSIGDLLISCYTTGGTWSSISDSQGESWTIAASNISHDVDTFIHFRYITVAGSMTVTVTKDTLNADQALQIYRVTGARATNPVGASAFQDIDSAPGDPRTTTTFTSTVANSVMLVCCQDFNTTGGTDTSSDLTVTTTAGSVGGAGQANSLSGFKTLGAPGSQSFQVDFPGTSTATFFHWAAIEIIPAATTPPFQPTTPRVWSIW